MLGINTNQFTFFTVFGVTLVLPGFCPVAIASTSTFLVDDEPLTTTELAQTAPTLPKPDFQRPATQPTPAVPPPTLPPADELLPQVPASPGLPSNDRPTGELPGSIVVKKFKITGSTVFSAAELDRVTAPFINRPLDFAQLLQAANEITQLYQRNGYISSGAYLPGNQTFDVNGGTIEIRVLEGRVEDIVVTGTSRLHPSYIKNRIGLGTNGILKIDRLVESLQLLQQDPLIKSITAELVSGQQPNTSNVYLKVTENPNWQAFVGVANNRTPSVGEILAQVSLAQNNLTGNGDSMMVTYGRGEGSSVVDINYTLPLNPHNGTLRLQYSNTSSRVVEAPFDRLDINSSGEDFSLTYRQPILRTPTQELALGLSLARRETNTGYLLTILGQRIGYPSPGADANGGMRVAAVRFFQDYTTKDSQQVFAARSQISIGLNSLGSTSNTTAPDSQFLTWRGQAQYVRALAPNSLLVLKLEGQLADRPLLALEQIGLGGQDTVRGYRQDLLLADNGILASAEVRLPVFTSADSPRIFQIVPFLDFGYAWNQPNNPGSNPNPSLITSGGLGLRYQEGGFNAKLDYGIPFTTIEGNKRTGQEQGFHFSASYNYTF
jgi:hemolysin activation/secretion protein